MDTVAVFGIGSTNFRAAVALSNGDFVTEIDVERTRPQILEGQLLEKLEELQAATSDSLDAVAVSTTGLVDRDAGVIAELDTASGETVEHLEVGPTIEEAWGLPVYVENDCNAAALGQWHFGPQEGYDSVAYVTFGTGIGGGVVERGRLVRGESGQAGEFGLLSVAPESDLESTGVTGAWEAFCSGRGIPRYVEYRRSIQNDDENNESQNTDFTQGDANTATARAVFQAADRGDTVARECLERVARYNAAGIGAICNAFNPGLLTFGGGVALNNPGWLLEGIDRHLEEFLFVDRPALRITSLGDDIELYGALAAFLDQTHRTRERVDGQSTHPVRPIERRL